MFRSLETIGRWGLSALDAFGDFCRFSAVTLGWLAASFWRLRRLRQVMPQFFAIGAQSLPVVLITGAFVGMVLAVQTVIQFQALGFTAAMGSIINLTAVRELGPVLAGVILAGRVGGGLTAELGTMRVTEQLDALRAMGSDPVKVLVVPRFLACVLMIPALVLYANVTAIWGGFAVSVYVYNVSAGEFWAHAAERVEFFDIFHGLFKSIFFGAFIGLISCYKAFRCQAGAAGVGRACTEAFVASCMAILALDFFLSMLLNTIYEMAYGPPAVGL